VAEALTPEAAGDTRAAAVLGVGAWYALSGLREAPPRERAPAVAEKPRPPEVKPAAKPAKAAAWSDRPSARDQAIDWLKEHNRFGPKHAFIAATARQLAEQLPGGRAFV